MKEHPEKTDLGVVPKSAEINLTRGFFQEAARPRERQAVPKVEEE